MSLGIGEEEAQKMRNLYLFNPAYSQFYAYID